MVSDQNNTDEFEPSLLQMFGILVFFPFYAIVVIRSGLPVLLPGWLIQPLPELVGLFLYIVFVVGTIVGTLLAAILTTVVLSGAWDRVIRNV